MGDFLGDEVVAEVNFAVQNAEVEVVAGAEFSFRHKQVVTFFSDDYPDCAVAGSEGVFFDAVFFEGFQSLGEALPEKVVEFSEVFAVEFAFLFCCAAYFVEVVDFVVVVGCHEFALS